MQLKVFHVKVTDDESSAHTENTVLYNIYKNRSGQLKLILSRFSSSPEETSWVNKSIAVMF